MSMADVARIRSLVLQSLAALNELRSAQTRFRTTDDMALYGAGGVLDSLELVNLVVDLEQRLDEEMGAIVTLTDEKAVSQRHSPFRSVPALVEFVATRVSEQAGQSGGR
jgi:acyl carrier protein